MTLTLHRLTPPLFIAIAAACTALLTVGCSDHNAGEASSPTVDSEATAWRQVTLSVPGMDCPMCPITVRNALQQVDGVAEVEASLGNRQAAIRFDPAKTDIDALLAATARAGFPSQPLE